MSKRKTTTRRLAQTARRLALAAAFGCAACAGPERPLIDQFFAASRLRDRTALQKISTVVFEPRERGIVTTFDVVKVESLRDGGRDRKNVTITAPVALPDGGTRRETLLVALQRDEAGRWMITGVQDESRP